MKINTLKQIIENKKQKTEFSIITDLSTGETKILKKDLPFDEKLKKYSKQINDFLKSKKNGIISDTNLFVETFVRPIKVIIVGAVHIAQYLVDYAKSLNFEIHIIDPRGYFASEKRFPSVNIINKWPDEALKELETDESTALIALTHDPKIDDPALKHALDKKFVFIGFSAWLLLIPLAITSSDKMVKLLKHNWKKLHKLIYVISIFGVLHFIWLSKTIYFKPLIFLIILIILLLFRIKFTKSSIISNKN